MSPVDEKPPAEPQMPGPSKKSAEDRVAAVFVGRLGIRAGWRWLIFIAILMVCAGVLGILSVAVGLLHLPSAPKASTEEFTASSALVQEIIFVIAMTIAAFVMSRIEKRKLGRYGLPARLAFGRRFWEGAAWGFVAITATLLLIGALHGFSFGNLALSGRRLILYALVWGAAFLLTGFGEEFVFRGYSQFTLTTGMGFWPAAILLSIMFGALHLGNVGEGWPGALSAGLIGFFFCFTLRRTGTIWFAVGLHAAWDYGETFVYGVPDSGLAAPGHLLNSSFHGPRWLTGGTIGPEASVACFVILALLFLVFHFCYPRRALQDGTE